MPKLDETQERLLDAASQVFAEHGFKKATVRMILEKAGVKNMAAIKYYFGDKERLYIEAVKHAHQRTCMTRDQLPHWEPGTPAEQKLRDFIHSFVKRMVEGEDPVPMQLMMRELAQPTQACAELVRDHIRPAAQVLVGILGELLPEASPVQRMMTGFSIVSQIIFYRQNRAIVALLSDLPEFQKYDGEQLAKHITAFSLAAIRAAKACKEEEVPA